MISGADLWVGLIERIGYGPRKTEPYIRLDVKKDGVAHVFHLDLDTAAKLQRRLNAYIKAGRSA